MALTYDQIGAFSFIRLEGDTSVPTVTLADRTRDGVDGAAYKAFGTRGQITRLKGIADVASAAAADTLRDSYAAIKGTRVTIVKNGVSRTNMTIVDCGAERGPVCATASGGLVGGSHLVYSWWDVQKAEI